MAAAKFVVLLALLQLSAAWLLPQHTENFTYETATANCSGTTYEDWLEVQPQPVFVDVFPGQSEPVEDEEVEEAEEAEGVEEVVEAVVEIDQNVDTRGSASIDLVDDDEDGVEEVDDPLQDFIVNDDVLLSRSRRDAIGEDTQPPQDGGKGEDSDENDAIKDSSEEGGNEAKSSEEKSNEKNSSEETKENSEEENDDPYAFLRVKVDNSAERMLAPQERVKVMLKNFQKGRMNFLVTVSSQKEDDLENTGSFDSQPFLIKLKGCWLEHKHKAHTICKRHHSHKHHGGGGHGHGRHHHGHGRHHHGSSPDTDNSDRHHDEHHHDEHHHGEHDRGEHHLGEHHRGEHHRGEHHRGEHHRGEHHRGEHHQERHPHAEANAVDNESGRDQKENNTAFDFRSHKFLEPAEGEALLCSPTQLEGWLGPESKMVIAYAAPTRGCIVIRAYASYPIHNGSLVLTSEGNIEYLYSLICVQPNPIPKEDEDDEDDDESIGISNYSDNEGNDTANIVDTVNIVDTNASTDEENEDDERNSFTPRRGRAGYNLRPRPTENKESESSEQGSDEDSKDDEKDEDYVPSFLNEERSRRSPDEMSNRQLRRREQRQIRQAHKEERRLRRESRHSRRDAGDDPSNAADNLVEEEGGQTLNARQQRRQQKKEQRRLQRQERRQGRQGAVSSESTPEATPSEGRRGRGGRKNRPERPSKRPKQPSANNRRLHSNLTDTGSKFCCKQGIQHKKASTYPNDDGTTPELNCSVVPDEVPSWAAHKHPISKEVCEGHYVRCCNEFDLELWKAFQDRREARRAQRGNRQHG